MERDLSPSERAVWLMDQAAPCQGVVTAHVQGVLTEEMLRPALLRAQERHPLLRVRVVPGPRPRFSDDQPLFPEDLPLRVVPRDGAETWHAVLEDELHRPFDAARAPLWRAVLVAGAGESELVLCHHHVVADALSAAIHLREVLADAAAGAAGGPLPEPAPLPLRPSLNELLPMGALRVARCINSFVWRSAGARLRGWPRKLVLDACPPPGERRTRVLHLTLSPEETAALAARSRAAGTTVQGALGAALLLATFADLRAGEAPARAATVGCFSTINLRDHLRQPVPEDVGLFVSQATTFHRLGPRRAFWDLAVEFRRAVGAAIEAGEPYMTFPWLGMFVPGGDDPGPGLLRRIDQAMPAAVGLTNIGRLDVPPRFGPLVLRRLHVAIGVSLAAPLVAAVTTAAGVLSCNLLYVEPLLSRARAAAIGAHLRRLLLEAAGEGPVAAFVGYFPT